MYDLHTHTYCSDGVLSPTELVQLAKRKQVNVLAITDHDTLAALPEAEITAKNENITLIKGVEISTTWKKYDIHIVGLNIDPNNSVLQQGLEQQRIKRQERAKKIGQNLEKYHIKNAFEEASKYANGEVGRLHYARYLIDAGFVKDTKQAFQQYLKVGKAGVANSWLEIREAISWITAANGIAVLAHPLAYALSATQLKQLCAEFVAVNGKAIEVISGKQTLEDTWRIAALSKYYGLLASVGSDYHETKIGKCELGACAKLPEGCSPIWEHFC